VRDLVPPGLERHPWWPDWRGEAAAVVASGASAKKAGVHLLRGRLRVIAIKETHELAPWADAVYGCDAAFWRNRRGLPEFSGLKISFDKTSFPEVKKIEIEDTRSEIFLFDEPGKIGSGGNSGFQAVNLAIQFGARKVLMIGIDASSRGGLHWYGENRGFKRSNPMASNFERWVRSFAKAAAQPEMRSVEVINASPESAISCFKKDSVEATLRRWGLIEEAA
jgi:hypothetical protein